MAADQAGAERPVRRRAGDLPGRSPDPLAPGALSIRWPTALAILAAAAALLRLAYLLEFRARSLYWQVMLLDAAVYDAWARRIAGGDLLGTGVFPLPPLYPYLVAAVYAVAGASPRAVLVLQAALGVACVVLTAALARRIGGRRAGLWAGVLALGYAPLAFFETKLLNATLTVLLTLLLAHTCLWARRCRTAAPGRRWLAAGAALGLLALTRPEMLLLAPALAWWSVSGAPPGTARRVLPALGAGLALVLAPVAARNAVAAGAVSPSLLISSQGALTLYQANNPRAAGLYVSLAREGFTGDPATQADEMVALASRAAGRPLDLPAAQRFWAGRALDWIRTHPGDWLRLELRKLVRFFRSTEPSTEHILAVERERVRTLWLMPIPFGLLAALGLAGYVSRPRPPRRDEGDEAPPRSAPADALTAGHDLMALILASNLAACLIFYVSSRYRLPAVVALLVLGGLFVDRALGWWSAVRRGDPTARPALRRWLLLAGVAAIAFHVPLDRRHVAQAAHLHASTGTLHYNRGEYGDALREYRRAVAMAPGLARGHLGIAVTHEARGERDAALGAYRRALSLDPDLTAAREGAARLAPR